MLTKKTNSDLYFFNVYREWNHIDILLISHHNNAILAIENKVGSIENGPKGNIAKYDITINVSSSGSDGSSKTKSMEVDTEKYSTIPKTCDNYNLLYQTDRYYCACKSDDSNNIDLFVFLTAISQKELDAFSHLQQGEDLCWCEKYINICYQDILDYVIEPFAFTLEYADVWAYDLNAKANKMFKLTRMEEVTLLGDWTKLA